MGTRSLTHIEDNGKILCTIYRQFDGYPTGHGADLVGMLNAGKATIINGIGANQKIPEFFNGMGCLAAYVVGKLKGGYIGGIYLYPSGAKGCGEEYTYTLYLKDNLLHLRVNGYQNYDGTLRDFDPVKVENSEEDSG